MLDSDDDIPDYLFALAYKVLEKQGAFKKQDALDLTIPKDDMKAKDST